MSNKRLVALTEEQDERIWYVADQEPVDGNGIFNGPQIPPGTALVEASSLTTANQQTEEPTREREALWWQLEAADNAIRKLEEHAEKYHRDFEDVVEAKFAAEVQRDTLREGMERIAECPCDNNDTGNEDECPELIRDPGTGLGQLCPTCEARSLLPTPPAKEEG